ncbi:MAG: DUF2723 domain-containing protein [Planctomycetes bacterium]|nr:DUF2723 domain-containing protein [Planctomycetota bacterium]
MNISKNLGFVLFIVVLMEFLFSLAPGVMWGDSAKLVIMSDSLVFRFNGGAHPLLNFIGFIANQVLPFGDTAYRQNLVSAFFGALDALMLFYLFKRLVFSDAAAFVISAAFALSHIHWHLSVITESYTLTLFILLALMHCFLGWQETGARKWLYGCSFILGLGLCNFLLFIPFGLFFIILMAYGRRKELCNCRVLPIAAALFLAGYALVLVPFIASIPEMGFRPALRELLDLRYSGHLFFMKPFEAVKGMAMYFCFLAYQFPSPIFVLGFIGAIRLFRRNRQFFILTMLIFWMTVLFTSTYMEQRKYYIMLPSFLMFAVWSGYGAERLMLSALRHDLKAAVLILCIALPLGVYHIVPRALASRGVEVFKARTVPYRDNTLYFLQPFKNKDDGAIRFAKEVFSRLKPGSVVIADFTPLSVLDYYQMEHADYAEEGLHLINPSEMKPDELVKFIDENYAKGVYLADVIDKAYSISEIEKHYEIRKLSSPPVYEVVRK